MDEKVNCDDLIYRYNSRTPDEKFDKSDDALDLIDKIENSEIKLTDAENDQKSFKSSLSEIKKQKNKKNIYNIDMLYKARNEAIKFFDNYTLMVSEAKHEEKNKTSCKGLKILTPKQLFQRLPIAR